VLSGLLESSLFGHLTTVVIIVAVIIVLTSLVLIKELVDFGFTDTVPVLQSLLFLDSVGELPEIGLLKRVWLDSFIGWFVADRSLSSISLLHFDRHGEPQNLVMAHNLAILSGIVPKLIVQGQHDSGDSLRKGEDEPFGILEFDGYGVGLQSCLKGITSTNSSDISLLLNLIFFLSLIDFKLSYNINRKSFKYQKYEN
jgi:hypothetical protein